eukprot:CAMPEP_0181337040 /NCGR_PEP_ID=MMETSP1101-20121128/27775_1 /TAXON_ID=46948 /ORGANISM="Rhodomonas abbreviata, Strain Caron Lab Isolate" /LENGTH=60 /DNA_ID=CAMNT_0023447445 /DNA_START=1 /DNA_END=183 /DNA_ORIENTATION=-
MGYETDEDISGDKVDLDDMDGSTLEFYLDADEKTVGDIMESMCRCWQGSAIETSIRKTGV